MSDPIPLLKLAAVDADDLAIISGALQDAIVPIGDLSFEPGTDTFVLAANRVRWEAIDPDRSGKTTERVNAGLSFSKVVNVRRRGIDFRARGSFLNLLALTCTADPDAAGLAVDLTFSGDAAIRLETTELLCHLEDFGEPWPTQWRPQHADD
jgi:hypothetical protein